MGLSNGKITAPINYAEPYQCMGVGKYNGSYDLGYICSNAHKKINKWSKNKPYDVDKKENLTDAEKKGTPAQNISGIYYGLKASTSAGNLYELHNIAYEYVGYPKGGANSPYRINDFVGYDHNAVPTLNGIIPAEAYFNLEKSFGCTISYDYNHTNTTGVDMKEIIDSLSDSATFEDYYPCILVNGYARGLFNSQTGTQTPIRYNNAWHSAFYANMDGYPGISTGTYKCTLFFIRELYLQGVIDLRTWFNVQGVQSARNAFAVPNAIAVNVNLKRYNPYPVMEITSARRNMGNTGIELSYAFPGGKPTADTTYRIQLYDPASARKDFTYNASGINTIAITFTWSELGFVTAPTNKVKVSGSITVGETHNSTFNFTDI